MKYHVRRSEREITDPVELRDILTAGRTCTLALARDNEPYLVTLSYGYDRKADVLYFHCGKEGQKIDFIRANPRTCATVIEDDGIDQASCDHSYRSVVIHGHLTMVNDPAAIQQAIRFLVLQMDHVAPELKLDRLKAGDHGYDSLQILKLDIEHITGKCRHAKPKLSVEETNV